MEALAKQPPVTLEIALAQIIEIKEDSQAKNKKGRHDIQGTSDKRDGATSEAKASDSSESEGAGEKNRG